MNRTIKFSMLMAMATVAMMLSSGCKKDDPVGSGNIESDSFNGKVTAKVESGGATTVMAIIGPEIRDNTLYGVMYTETNYSNGGFSISLPGIPAEDLMNIDDFFIDILKVSGKLTYSAPEAQVTDIDFLGFDADDYLAGYYLYKSSDGRTICFFVYTDRDVTVTGGTNIAVSLKKGWNRLYQSTEKLATKAPSEMKWYFQGL